VVLIFPKRNLTPYIVLPVNLAGGAKLLKFDNIVLPGAAIIGIPPTPDSAGSLSWNRPSVNAAG
jgi:hypothetical protein